MKTIEEKNLIIQNFMGASGVNMLGNKTTPKYHKDWNCLINVIEKIEGFLDENNCAKYNVVIEQCFVEIIDNKTSDIITSIDANTKIEACICAVLEFIEWYNENNEA